MRITAFIFCILTIVGCTKKTDVFVFDCVIYDDRVDAPVSNAAVTMSVQNAVGGFNPNFNVVGTATTDANGRFYIEVDKAVYYSYRLEVSHPQHFEGTFAINPDDVPFSTAYANTFNLEPKAWIATSVFNQNGSQTVTFAVDAETDECSNCCTDNARIIQGFPVDTTFICQVYGQQTVNINGTYVDNGGGIFQIAETTFVQAFDTTTINIIY